MSKVWILTCLDCFGLISGDGFWFWGSYLVCFVASWLLD